MADIDPQTFFTNRDEVVGIAITECVRNLLSTHIDGNYLGSWILTEISVWNMEKERLLLLSTKTLTIVKYDFIALTLLDYRKISLGTIDTIINGDLVYPARSLAPACKLKGVRLLWNRGVEVPFLKKWNPFRKDIPYVTFTSHPLVWHKEVPSKYMFDIDDFIQMIVLAVENVEDMSTAYNHVRCRMEDKPVIRESYVGLTSMIHNRNGLGFFKAHRHECYEVTFSPAQNRGYRII